MREVREAFERALADTGEIDAAIALAERFPPFGAGDPVAIAYLGSLNAMKAGHATLPWVKLRHANIASEMLDHAHERRFEPAGQNEGHPAELVILLLRGIAYASFPSFLGRGAAARESLEEAAQHPGFAQIPASYQALVHTHLAALPGARDESCGMDALKLKGA